MVFGGWAHGGPDGEGADISLGKDDDVGVVPGGLVDERDGFRCGLGRGEEDGGGVTGGDAERGGHGDVEWGRCWWNRVGQKVIGSSGNHWVSDFRSRVWSFCGLKLYFSVRGEVWGKVYAYTALPRFGIVRHPTITAGNTIIQAETFELWHFNQLRYTFCFCNQKRASDLIFRCMLLSRQFRFDLP